MSDNMDEKQPRITDLIAAHTVLGLLLHSDAAAKGFIRHFAMTGTRITYCNGPESVCIEISTRNFMDDRRDAMVAKAHDYGTGILINPPRAPLSIGAKVRVVSLDRRTHYGFDNDDFVAVGDVGAIEGTDDGTPAELCWTVRLSKTRQLIHLASSEIEVIEAAPGT